MTNRYDVELDAIILANKLGARGVKVIGFSEPTDATGTWEYTLRCNFDPDRGKTAADRAWYDD